MIVFGFFLGGGEEGLFSFGFGWRSGGGEIFVMNSSFLLSSVSKYSYFPIWTASLSWSLSDLNFSKR